MKEVEKKNLLLEIDLTIMEWVLIRVKTIRNYGKF
jgi:hypothetical protein